MNNDPKILADLAKPLIEYLRKNGNPHYSVVVSPERVTLILAEASKPLPWEDDR